MWDRRNHSSHRGISFKKQIYKTPSKNFGKKMDDNKLI